MEQKDNSQKAKIHNWSKYFIGPVATVAVVIAIGLGSWSAIEHYKIRKQIKYAIEHLDQKAVSPEEFQLEDDSYNSFWTKYEDTDNDRDYESILQRRNSNGEYVSIPMEKGLEGKIKFLNLSETAVDPFNIPRNPWGLKIDYIEDEDGKLESITYLGLNNENFQRMKIEMIDGKYILSNF